MPFLGCPSIIKILGSFDGFLLKPFVSLFGYDPVKSFDILFIFNNILGVDFEMQLASVSLLDDFNVVFTVWLGEVLIVRVWLAGDITAVEFEVGDFFVESSELNIDFFD